MPSKRNKNGNQESPAETGLLRYHRYFAFVTLSATLTPACGGSSPSGPKPADAEMSAIHGRSEGLDNSFYTLDAGDGRVCGYYSSRNIHSFDKGPSHYLATKKGPIWQSDLDEAIDDFIVEQIKTAQD